jgi:HD-GYP domain-containing protein (c-di-GMP phosphodiesterase class II)
VSGTLEHTTQRAAVLARALGAVCSWAGSDAAYDRHARAVASLAVDIADELAVAPGRRFTVAAGALLHDIGKLLLDQEILGKPGPLDDGERRHVQTHAEAGAAALPESVPDPVRAVVRFHHERWDGSGYPDGICESEIPLEARIVAVADAFRAMLEDRPYRDARTQNEAIDEVLRSAGTQFDPACVRAFVRVTRTAPSRSVH